MIPEVIIKFWIFCLKLWTCGLHTVAMQIVKLLKSYHVICYYHVHQATSIAEFGNSWIFNPDLCTSRENPANDNYNPCNEIGANVGEAMRNCAVLRDVDGMLFYWELVSQRRKGGGQAGAVIYPQLIECYLYVHPNVSFSWHCFFTYFGPDMIHYVFYYKWKGIIRAVKFQSLSW